MKKQFLFVLLFSIFSTSESFSQSVETFFDKADTFFKTYVLEGKVAYKEICNNPEALQDVLEIAKDLKVSPSKVKTYQAFWINAYNLAVIKGIVDNYPLKSPLDKAGFFDKITYDLGGTSLTLNDLENKKLRAKFSEPRFHFVLVCGAQGCPPLISKAYKPDNLETLLEQQTIKALNNSSFIRVSDGKVGLSEIFKWYKEDFVKNGSTEIEFLNKYRTKKVPANAEITYYTYDWQLNSK